MTKKEKTEKIHSRAESVRDINSPGVKHMVFTSVCGSDMMDTRQTLDRHSTDTTTVTTTDTANYCMFCIVIKKNKYI